MFFAIFNLRRSLLLVVMCLISNQVFALSFKPTEAEWRTWGKMCQTRYVISGAGADSGFFSRVPSEAIKRWEQKVGIPVWHHLHHYCAGLIQEKRGHPEQAVKDYTYTFLRTPKSDPFYATIGLKISLASYRANDVQQAKRIVILVIDSHPNDANPYIVKSIIERKEGEFKNAVQTLENGINKAQKNPVELNYHLGLNYFSLGNFEAANKYAQIAYNLGYPLPWLREQLKIKGHWH